MLEVKSSPFIDDISVHIKYTEKSISKLLVFISKFSKLARLKKKINAQLSVFTINNKLEILILKRYH